MLQFETHGPVTRIEMSTPRSRLVGINVSMYLMDGVLIDTGFPDVRRDVGAWLDRIKPRGAIVTHMHEDHAGNVNSLAKRGIPVNIADETLAALRDVRPIGFYRHFTWSAMRPLSYEIERFDLGPFEFVHMPGHSTDHHVVWHPARRIMFGGDLYLGIKVRVSHPGEQLRVLVDSLRTAARMEPEMFFDGHRGLVSDPVDKLNAKADWLEQTIGEIDRLVEAGWTDSAIRRAVLGREDVTGYFSFGDYSRANFVRSVRDTKPSLVTNSGP
jgi:ribonuclease/clavin/mitogillin